MYINVPYVPCQRCWTAGHFQWIKVRPFPGRSQQKTECDSPSQMRTFTANRSLDVGLRLTWEKVIGAFAWISCILKASDSPWRTSDSSSRTESFQSGICSKASCLSRKNGTKMHKGHQASSSRLCFSNWVLCPLSLVAIDVHVFWPRLRVPLSSRLLLWQTKGCQNGQ